jgi:hypothetical protein
VKATVQPTLWDQPGPSNSRKKRTRHRTASTSSAGLDRVRPVRNAQQQLVLATLREHGRLTRHAIVDAIAAHHPQGAMPLSSVCGRVNELIEKGDVREVVVDGRKLVIDGRHVVEAVIHPPRAA